MKLFGFKLADHKEQMLNLLNLLLSKKDWDKKTYSKLIKKFTKSDGNLFSKDEVIFSYKQLAGKNGITKTKAEAQAIVDAEITASQTAWDALTDEQKTMSVGRPTNITLP